jgi:hypothetical protein
MYYVDHLFAHAHSQCTCWRWFLDNGLFLLNDRHCSWMYSSSTTYVVNYVNCWDHQLSCLSSIVFGPCARSFSSFGRFAKTPSPPRVFFIDSMPTHLHLVDAIEKSRGAEGLLEKSTWKCTPICDRRFSSSWCHCCEWCAWHILRLDTWTCIVLMPMNLLICSSYLFLRWLV